MMEDGVSGHAMSHSPLAHMLQDREASLFHLSLAHMLQDREASLDLWLTLLDCVAETVEGGEKC